MATYTRTEFVNRVLQELCVIDAQESPTAEDYTLVDEKTSNRFEELYEDGLIPFNVDGVIPSRYLLALISIVAADCYMVFGKDGTALEGKAEQGKQRLWKFRDRAYFATPTQATYF